jgi:hypothetical protein
MTEREMTQPRVRAPQFPTGLDWINTGGQPTINLDAWKGKIVFLDFWTYG